LSSLPLARYCGQAPLLGAAVDESGRAALRGTAFHANAAGVKGDHMARLTPEERAEVEAAHRPAPVRYKVAPGVEVDLHYEDASKEQEVTLKQGDVVSVGHLDLAWVVEVNGFRIAIVGDIKWSEFTDEDGPKSLQVQAYGFAWALKNNCTHFLCGIWAATEGVWSWGELIEVDGFEAADIWRDIAFAMANRGGPHVTGAHCRRCWSRFRCPAYLMPPEVASSSLAPLTDERLITPERLLALKVARDRAAGTLEAVDEFLKDAAIKMGGIPDGNGKVWRSTMTKGRESLDQKALKEHYGEDALKAFTKQGKPFSTMRWVNE
jgi:hypothetical protein